MDKQTYRQGWNDYIDGLAFSYINSTMRWQEGWIDCKEATKAYGKQKRF